MNRLKIAISILLCASAITSLFAQIDTYQAEQNTYFTQLKLSSHGLLFSDNFSSGIYTIKNGTADKIISGAGSGRYYTVSPDGNWIGYKQINKNGNQQAIIKNIVTGQTHSLTEAENLCGTPDFSNNGEIAYTSNNYLIFGDTIHLGYHINLVRISPNGQYISFADKNEQIALVNTQTREIKTISPYGKAAFYPEWSPNSDKLLYSSGNTIFIYNLQNNQTYSIENASAPSWYDNENILFQRNKADLNKLIFYDSNIYFSDYTCTNIVQLTNTPKRAEMNPISDGIYVYYHTYTNKELLKASINSNGELINETLILHRTQPLPIEYSSIDLKAERSIVYLGPVPYVHQKYDTPSWHNGSGSCAPTTCAMAFAYYNLLPPWNVSIDHGYSWDPHTNPYGSYVADKYRFNEIYYDTYEAAYGTDAWGGYGFMWDGDYSPGSRQRTYIENHYLSSNQLWLSACTFDNTTAEIDQGFVHPICSWITHSGHLTLAIGFIENQHTLIFNDPWGNKNTAGYPSYDGYDAYYDWPGFNNGYANLDDDGTHGGVAWTTQARGTETEYNDTVIDNNYYNHGFYINNTENGSLQRYYRDANTGYNGHFWYTGTMNTTNDWCYVTWSPTLDQAGDYEVFTYIPEVHANAENAHYIISHDNGSNDIFIDQSAHNGQWVSLGIYQFSPNNGGHVYLGDNTGVDGQDIAFDAVKWSIIPINLNITSTPVSCNGNADGTATVTPTDNEPPYQYLWNTSQTTSTITELSGGSYTVTVTNGQGTTMSSTITVFEPEPLEVFYTAINPSIAGFSTGEIILNVTGGVSPYGYTWNPAISTGNTANSLMAGLYQITVTDAHYCSESLSIELFNPQCNASYNLTADNISHCTAELSWASVTDALGYYVRWRISGESTWTEIFTDISQYTLTGLIPETTYEWEIATICNQAQSAYTESSFITQATSNVICTACKGIFTDTGGENNEYSNYEDYTYTIHPEGAEKITVWFNTLDLETNYDTLFVYDGINTNAPLITSYQDTYAGSEVSTKGICINSSGDALTFRFKSDYLTTNAGWDAKWTSYGSVCGNIPTTEINTDIDGDWASEDFNVNFLNTDYSNFGFTEQLWQVLYLDGTEWKANTNLGILNDNFNENLDSWTTESGNWLVQNGNLIQNDETNTNSNLYIPVNNNSDPILIHWQMKIEGTGNNRRAGLHFMCDNLTETNRNNSYMVYFRPDQNTVQMYEYVNDEMFLKTSDNANIEISTWYDCKVLYDPSTGIAYTFLDDTLVSTWTDDTPIVSGIGLSLRTGNCTAYYDNIKIYSQANASELLSIINHLDNTENQNSTTPACKVNALSIDGLIHFSNVAETNINIDLSPPANIGFINDGLSTDIDVFSNENISANWQHSSDPNSEVSHYEIAVGTAQGNDNVYEWTPIGYTNSYTISDITMFTNGSTYYTGIKAVNFAGLTGNTIWSDGETYLAPPVAAFNANVTSICTGESVSFTNNSINATNYSWTFYGGMPNFSNEPNPVVTYLNPGTYNVQLSVSGTSGSDELILENYIHVIDPPVAEFSWVGESTNETVYFTNTSSNATSYLWDFGDGNTSTETNPTHIFTDDGNYTISLTASNNVCPSDVSSENLVITLLPKYLTQSTLVKIIPNPNNGVFTVFFNRPINDIMEITDITGRIIWKQNCTNKQKEITLSDAIPGMYFLQLKQSGIISKIIIH